MDGMHSGLGFFHAKIQSIPMKEALEKLANRSDQITLLDVRLPYEYEKGHLKGSINIPLSQLERAEKQIGDKDRKLFVYCRTGARSAQACAMLMKMGFSDPINIGGIEEVDEKDEIFES